MRRSLCFISCVAFTLLSYMGWGQTLKINDLKTGVFQSKNDAEKLKALFALCDERHSLSTDSLYKYAFLANQISLAGGNKKEIAHSQYYLANYFLKIGLLDSALRICNENIKDLQNYPAAKELLLDYQGCRAGIYIKKNQYKDAFAQFYFILNNAELENDTIREITGRNGIGWVNMEMDKNRDALHWLFNALHTSLNPKYQQYYLYVYSNIAANYNSLKLNDSAESYIDTAIILARKFQNLSALANSLNIQADIFTDTKRILQAERSLNEAIEIRKQVGDPFYIVSDMMQLSKFYAKTGQTKKGIEISLEGIKMAHKFNLSSKLLILYDALAENYKMAGEFGKYAGTLEQVIAIKDSLYNKNSATALAEMQARYDLQKKENIIVQQKLDLISKNYLLYGSLIVILFGIIIIALIFKNYERKQLMTLALMQQDEKRISFIAVSRAEENERKRIAADLHDNMGAYATAMIANVDDLAQKRTQQQITLQQLKNNASEIMSHLRDTIWAMNKERILLTGISDRFKNYLQKISPAYPGVAINISETIITDISLSPVQALNIFRILQESLTNALKHSYGSEIVISIKCNKEIDISVEDNGTGINENNFHNGNGLKNMTTRAKESGIHINILRQNPGTRVYLYT